MPTVRKNGDPPPPTKHTLDFSLRRCYNVNVNRNTTKPPKGEKARQSYGKGELQVYGRFPPPLLVAECFPYGGEEGFEGDFDYAKRVMGEVADALNSRQGFYRVSVADGASYGLQLFAEMVCEGEGAEEGEIAKAREIVRAGLLEAKERYWLTELVEDGEKDGEVLYSEVY